MNRKENMQDNFDAKRLNKILIAVCLALMAVISSVSGLNVAQPELALAFNASQDIVLWIINIYTVSLAALLLPLGAAGDRWGRKPVLISGLALFGIANILSGLASSAAAMLVARLLAGVGAAMIMPVTLAVITSTFPVAQRSKAIGIWTGVAGGGGILGMYLSAALVDFATWRWLFVLPVFLVIVSIAMAFLYIPNTVEENKKNFDKGGAILSVIALVGIVFALHEAPQKGWSDVATISSLLIGTIAVLLFVAWELRHPEPLLDVRAFRSRGLSSGSATLLLVFGIQAGIFVVLFPFFQAVLNWSGLRSTLGMMPMAVLMMIASGMAPKVSKKLGKRPTMAMGVALSGSGLVLMANFVTITDGYLTILPGMLAMGMGMGLCMTPSTEAITSSLPEHKQGVASALNDVTREMGTALGVALLGALVAAKYSFTVVKKLAAFPEDVRIAASQGLIGAVNVAQTTRQHPDDIINIAKGSFIAGWQHAMWVGAWVMLVLFIYILFLGPDNNVSVNEETKN